LQQSVKHSFSSMVLGALSTTLSFVACSSGGGGDSGTAPATPSVSSGTITAFGSVSINDRKYEIDNSTLISDDGTLLMGDVSTLSVGMVVKVSGTTNGSSRTASTITHTDTLEGPMQIKVQVDPRNGTLTILGQTVVVDDTTKFDDTIPPTTLSSLAVGDVVEVSGFVKSDGVIVASFIERKAALLGDCSLGCEIKGIVKNHNDVLKTFQIGGLTVNYAAPAIISDMPARSGNNWDTLFVEVNGTVLAGATLNATKVEPEGFQAPEGNEVELEGFVSSSIGGPGTGHFMLGTTEVQAANALYLGGTKDEVAVGQKLEVEGTISGNVITAGKVKFQDAVRLEGNVVSKPISTMTLVGLTGLTISVNTQTEFKGGITNLADLNTGNHVRVHGRQDTGNSVIATEVERTDITPKDDLILQGVVQAATNFMSVTILGVDMSTANVENFVDTNDVSIIGIQAFFSALKPNATKVKATGKLLGSPVWKEMELESD